MRRAIVTGSGGLVGSETVAHLVEAGFDVVGLENDMRSYFFGPEASTRPQTERLLDAYGDGFRSIDAEIRDGDAVDSLFAEYRAGLELIVHTAAQPSHDWAASEPRTDFTINANGTLNLLEATRRHSPDATFVFASTNKVYGDRPNTLPFVELETRLELPDDHEYYAGIPTTYLDRPVAAFALRRVEGGRRPARPGVRALLRHAHGVLPRGLPHRTKPRGRSTARLPFVPDALHGHGRALHRGGVRRETGARQSAQRRPRAGIRGLSRRATRRRRLQHGRRPLRQLLDARSDRALRTDCRT